MSSFFSQTRQPTSLGKKHPQLSESEMTEAFDAAVGASGKNRNTFFEAVNAPKSPKNVSIEANMKEASERAGLFAGLMDYYWFMEQVKNKGPWDYKQQGREYQNFGNYNYGAAGYAAGIPESVLLRAAGWAQKQAGTSDESWGSYWFKEPYGDDPEDQRWIKEGIERAKKSGY
ncbi:polymorphic toxin type 44 domain-containing protein [Endozoicomonas sp. Mp262]|uniref:polymorphic toxin type 44 domain-containing protein n=1 Tax=Endozoicomonas sp. Mp262 TaxID=2919499 RepID=UPI0021DA0926